VTKLFFVLLILLIAPTIEECCRVGFARLGRMIEPTERDAIVMGATIGILEMVAKTVDSPGGFQFIVLGSLPGHVALTLAMFALARGPWRLPILVLTHVTLNLLGMVMAVLTGNQGVTLAVLTASCAVLAHRAVERWRYRLWKSSIAANLN
jgi:hypothetical protein